jgi:LPXTG-site transpeptidase (sortase) family protein
LIFGHTSQERWKHNPYGMAFAHIAQIEIWDVIQIVWKWQLYEYEVVDIQVKYPQHVNETYMQYANLPKNYVTLMWCYPIGTAKQRMLIVAEQL